MILFVESAVFELSLTMGVNPVYDSQICVNAVFDLGHSSPLVVLNESIMMTIS